MTTQNSRVVRIGEMVVSDDPHDVLIAYGLGSCVVVCLYDSFAHVGGMLHALLPAAQDGRKSAANPTKYVDQGVPLLIDAMQKLGAKRIWLKASLCGGAQLFNNHLLSNKPGNNGHLNIGKRNVLAGRAALQAARIRLHAQATGGSAGRTVRLYLADGKTIVKTLGKGERILE